MKRLSRNFSPNQHSRPVHEAVNLKSTRVPWTAGPSYDTGKQGNSQKDYFLSNSFSFLPNAPVHPDVVGRAGLSQPAAHWRQNIMLRRRAGTDAPYLHHRQHRDAPRTPERPEPPEVVGDRVVVVTQTALSAVSQAAPPAGRRREPGAWRAWQLQQARVLPGGKHPPRAGHETGRDRRGRSARAEAP